MLDVITIGSAVLDIFVISDQFNGNCISEGKVEAQELIMVAGGGAANNAVSFVRKGLSAAPIIEMGCDLASDAILSELKKESVSAQLSILEEKETTAISIILISNEGKSSILTYRGASRLLSESDIPFDKLGFLLKPGGWIHLTSLGGNIELSEKIITWAKQKNRKVFWNPGGAELRKFQISNSEGPELGRRDKFQITPDILQLNKNEAARVFGSNIPNFPNAILIVTNGVDGGTIYHQGQTIPYSGLPVTMLDSTGAGDSFGSAFVAALALGNPISTAIEWGRRQGAEVVKHIGAKKGLMTIEQLKEGDNFG